jgi:hypothetical protein
MHKIYSNAEKIGRGSIKNLTKLLDENHALGRKRIKKSLHFVQEFKAKAEAIMDDDDHKSKISDFQLFKRVERAFEPSARKQVRMRMMLNGKQEEVEINTQSWASGSNTGESSTSGANTFSARRYKTVCKSQTIDWNEFDNWCWYVDEFNCVLK